MPNSGKLFADELNNWLMDKEGLKLSQYKISIYYNYAPYWSKLVVLFYVDDCLYWYKSE